MATTPTVIPCEWPHCETMCVRLSDCLCPTHQDAFVSLQMKRMKWLRTAVAALGRSQVVGFAAKRDIGSGERSLEWNSLNAMPLRLTLQRSGYQTPHDVPLLKVSSARFASDDLDGALYAHDQHEPVSVAAFASLVKNEVLASTPNIRLVRVSGALYWKLIEPHMVMSAGDVYPGDTIRVLRHVVSPVVVKKPTTRAAPRSPPLAPLSPSSLSPVLKASTYDAIQSAPSRRDHAPRRPFGWTTTTTTTTTKSIHDVRVGNAPSTPIALGVGRSMHRSSFRWEDVLRDLEVGGADDKNVVVGKGRGDDDDDDDDVWPFLYRFGQHPGEATLVHELRTKWNDRIKQLNHDLSAYRPAQRKLLQQVEPYLH